MPGYRHDYLKFDQLTNSSCFPIVCYFSREKPLVKLTAPGSSFSYIYLAIYFFLAFIFRSIKPKNTIIPCCNLFVLQSIYPIYHFYLTLFSYLQAPYPKGIDNPFNTSGCEYLLFVCKCCLHGVRRFSYWFENLDLITEGNTYRRYTASSLPLWGNTDVASSDIKRNFWRHCRGGSST